MHEAEQRSSDNVSTGLFLTKRRLFSRRNFLYVAVAGLAAACSSAPSTQPSSLSTPFTPKPSPTPVVLAPGAPISPANASKLVKLAVLNPNSGRVRGLAWSPDGKTLAVGTWQALQLWDVALGKQVAMLPMPNGQFYQLAWSPDGQLLAAGVDDNTLRIWDAHKVSPLKTLQGSDSVVLSVAWSSRGDRLAAGNNDGTVQVWERATWAKPAVWNGPAAPGQYHAGRFIQGVYGVAWSPDGRRLAGVRYDGYVRVWDAVSGQLVRVLVPSNQPNGVSWSPDGQILASSSDDGTMQFWDSRSYKNRRTLQSADEEQAGWAYAIAWSPDGRLLAGSRSTGIVQIWDTQSGKELAVLQGHADSAWTAAWSPDNLRVASGSDDGTVCLWGVR